MGPRSIPERHGKCQNFKAAAALTLGVFIPLKLINGVPVSFLDDGDHISNFNRAGLETTL